VTDGTVRAAPADGARLKRRRAWGSGLLLAGVAALGATDLAFAFHPAWWILLLPGGLLLVLVGWVMLASTGRRSALAATAAVVLSYFALTAAAPTLRSLSWRALVWTHQEALDGAVGILRPVRMEGEARRVEPVCANLPGLRPGDCSALRAAMSDVGAHGAWQEGAVTVLETYSWINVRGGLLHCTADCEKPRAGLYPRYVTHVDGDWYRWVQ
jgi:hypothetical protein